MRRPLRGAQHKSLDTGAITMTRHNTKAAHSAAPANRSFQVTIAETRYSIITVEAPTARAAKAQANEIFLLGEPDNAFTAPYTMRITAKS
jgi:hypothetical protein